MLLIVIFISITVPYRIAFEDVTPQEWLICDIVLDTLFLIDICLNFFTATENESGELVTDLKLIAMQYVKTWLFVDIASSIPISLIQQLTQPEIDQMDPNSNQNMVNVRIIKLTRLPRLYRLLRLLKLIRLYKSNKFI